MTIYLDESVHPASLDDEELLEQTTQSKDRSGGPGGQHRNKVETRVSLVHRPTGISAIAGERRSVMDNRRVAVRRLRLALAVRVRCPVPTGEVGSPLWRGRVQHPRGARAGRIVCSVRHRDYPSLLAEALDVIADAGWDVRRAALRLGVSASQLIKLVREHPPAFEALNAERRAHNLRPLG